MNNHPEILSCVLPLVLQGLGNSKVGTAATMALKDITRESLDHIRPFIPQILSTSQVSSTLLRSGQTLSLLRQVRAKRVAVIGCVCVC